MKKVLKEIYIVDNIEFDNEIDAEKYEKQQKANAALKRFECKNDVTAYNILEDYYEKFEHIYICNDAEDYDRFIDFVFAKYAGGENEINDFSAYYATENHYYVILKDMFGIYIYNLSSLIKKQQHSLDELKKLVGV